MYSIYFLQILKYVRGEMTMFICTHYFDDNDNALNHIPITEIFLH